MTTFYEEGGEAIMHFALDLPCPANRHFQEITDPEFTGSKKGGSDNLDLLANVPGWIYARGLFDEMALSVGLEENLIEERKKFQRNEILSVPYTTIHLVTRLAGYKYAKQRGSDLEKPFREWLENFWSICRLTEHRLKNGRDYLCFAGERSSGYPHPNWFGHHMAWKLATGGEEPIAQTWAGQIKKAGHMIPEIWYDEPAWSKTDSWIDVAMVGFAPEIRATASKFLTCSMDEVVKRSPKFTFRDPVFIYRTTEGVAQWWGRPGERASYNGNTGPIGAIRGERGAVVTCPPDGGPKWRQKVSNLNTNVNQALTSVHVEWPEIEFKGDLALPAGEIVTYLMIDPVKGWVDLTKDAQEEPEVIPGNPNETREYDEATALLIHMFKPVFQELNESNTTADERAYLTSELQEMANRWKTPSNPAKKPWWKF